MYKTYVGTSGFAVSQKIYFDSCNLNSVELDSIFYKIPRVTTVEKWYDEAPKDFKFSPKMWRGITHYKRLHDVEDIILDYIDVVRCFKKKLGVILFQFPPSFHNTSTVSTLDNKTNFERLKSLSKILPKNMLFAFEFRHTSWLDKKVILLMKKNNWAFVSNYVNNKTHWMGDIPNSINSPWPSHIKTANFTYTRLHGPDGKFRGLYTSRELKSIHRQLNTRNRHHYVYFNNTYSPGRRNLCKLNGKEIHSPAFCNACQFYI